MRIVHGSRHPPAPPDTSEWLDGGPRSQVWALPRCPHRVGRDVVLLAGVLDGASRAALPVDAPGPTSLDPPIPPARRQPALAARRTSAHRCWRSGTKATSTRSANSRATASARRTAWTASRPTPALRQTAVPRSAGISPMPPPAWSEETALPALRRIRHIVLSGAVTALPRRPPEQLTGSPSPPGRTTETRGARLLTRPGRHGPLDTEGLPAMERMQQLHHREAFTRRPRP